MDSFYQFIQSILPASLNAAQVSKYVALVIGGALLLGLIGRFAFGKRSALNHSVSSAIGILFMYVIFVVITIFVTPLATYISPLPFIRIEGDYLYIFPILSSGYQDICSQILSILILSFIINLLDSLIPNAKKVVGWFFRNICVLTLGFLLHGVANFFITRYFPQALLTWAPVVLLAVIAFLLLLSFLKVLFGVAMTVVNPVIAAVYTFFFANKIGKLFSKALFTSVLLLLLVCAMNWIGFTSIYIAISALTAYIPFLIILLALWFLLGKVL